MKTPKVTDVSKVRSAPNPTTAGYPVDVKNTQTVKTRGTGAATKGIKSSSKLG